MKNLALKTLGIGKLIFTSLKPIGLIFSIIFILGASLFIYDGYQTIKDRQLGAKLIDNIKIEGECNKSVGSGEKFTIKFNILNNNTEPVVFEKLQIDRSLTGIKDAKFLMLGSTSPKFTSYQQSGSAYAEYNFYELTIKKFKKESLSLMFKAASRTEAQAAAHSFNIYKGEIDFIFNHEMEIQIPCQIQVRYSD